MRTPTWAPALFVGIAVWPLRRVATRIADRLVFGRRATPYQVLSEFSGRVAETYAADDVLERMAQILGEALGADAATVWLRVGDRFRPEASWPADETVDGTVPASAVEVRHQGAVLGALSVRMPANDPMNPSKERLIRTSRRQAGLVLRNAALIEDLRASRQRLVAAQDQERRRIERNIHDGAQQQLVALAVKLRLADALVGKDEERAHALLSELHGETSQALEDLRDLARGIYPPLLADKGLAVALEGQARKSVVPVTVAVGRDRSLPAGDRGRRLLLVSRGAAERREVRGRLGGDDPARAVERIARSSTSSTTASASIRRPPRAAPDSRGSPTGSPRSAAASTFAARLGAGRRSSASFPRRDRRERANGGTDRLGAP